MFFSSRNSPPPSWAPEDVEALKETLAEEFPEMPCVVLEAIVALAVEEVKPDQGQAPLHRLAVRFARECPPTISPEATLASLSNSRTGPATLQERARHRSLARNSAG
eukprot:gene21677-26558_t